MKKFTLVLLALVWILSLIILIISLTDIYPNNPFISYRLIVGLGFLVISGLIGKAYQQILKTKESK